jgi:peptidoglycan/LPS O-acetylase OafA/YrhL
VAVADTTSSATSADRVRYLPHFAGLDGLRGLAVAAVVLFHSDFAWAKGGYLGVSTFFTLSGFLITALLLSERGATGGISLLAFWTRRFRRLMPGAFAAIALAIVFAVVAGDAAQQRNLGGDVSASILYVANWRFIFSGQSYAALFTSAPSPLLHFWSLAIEEQFYLLYPLLAYWLLHVRVLSRQLFAAVLGGLLVVSIALTQFGGFSLDRIYYGTDTRAAEILVGALLACVFFDRRVTHRLAHDVVAQRWFAVLGAVALGSTVALWSVAGRNGGIVRDGWLPAYAVLSALIIVAVLIPHGPVRLVLELAPLRWLGLISYGVYLYHWPLFLWLDADRTNLSGAPLLAVRVAATLALSVVSYRLLEQPVRRGHRLVAVPPIRLAPVAALALIAAAVVITTRAPAPTIDFAASQRSLEASIPSDVPVRDTGLGEPPFPRMAVFGDSTAMLTGFGLNDWARTNPDKADLVGTNTLLGCGIGRGGERRDGNGEGPLAQQCNDWAITWAQTVRTTKPTIAVVQIGPWEVNDRKLDGDTEWRAPGDPIYDAFLLEEMTTAVDVLSKDGATVVWLTSPAAGEGNDGGKARAKRGVATDPVRMERLNEIIKSLPEQRPGKVGVVDLAGWLATSGVDDNALRPDGVHFSQESSPIVAEEFLGDAIITTANDIWKANNTFGDADSIAAPPPTDQSTTAPSYAPDARSMLVVGDAAAASVAPVLDGWGKSSGVAKVTSAAIGNCGFTRSVQRDNRGSLEPEPAECANAVDVWIDTIERDKPDFVVVAVAETEVTDHVFSGDSTRRGPGDPTYEQTFSAAAVRLVDAATAAGAATMWVIWPHIDPGPALPASEPARMDRLNAVINLVRGARPKSMMLIDLAAEAQNWPGGEFDPAFRSDRVVLGGGSVGDTGEWLGGAIITADTSLRTS